MNHPATKADLAAVNGRVDALAKMVKELKRVGYKMPAPAAEVLAERDAAIAGAGASQALLEKVTAERDAAIASAAALRAAVAAVVDDHVPDHHRDDCPDPGECEQCATAKLINVAMADDAGHAFLERLKEAQKTRDEWAALFDNASAYASQYREAAALHKAEAERLRAVLLEIASGVATAWAGDAGPAMEVEHMQAKARAAVASEEDGGR